MAPVVRSRSKLCMCASDMILHLEDPNESTKKTIRTNKLV